MPTPDAMPNEAAQTACDNRVTQAQTGLLLTCRNGHPFGSHVPCLLGDDWFRVLPT